MADVTNIINQVLDILRTQSDSEGMTELTGSVPVDPAKFTSGNALSDATQAAVVSYNNVVIGPIVFQTSYDSPPQMQFTQYGDQVDSDIRQAPTASNYTPFLVQPYVYGWDWEDGGIAGFYLGLYAITDPRVAPQSHQLVWTSKGPASRYLSPTTTEAWTQDYSYDPDYLTEDATDDTYNFNF